MKKSTKILLIAAVVLIGLGAVLTLCGLAFGASPFEAVRQGLFSIHPGQATVGISFEEKGSFDNDFDWEDRDFTPENSPSPQGRYELKADGIHSLEIDWISGGIELSSHAGSGIIIEESGPEEFTPENSLVYSEDKGVLKLSFCDGSYSRGRENVNIPSKHLLVLLPEDTDIERIRINTVNDDTLISIPEAEELTVSSANGKTLLRGLEAERVVFNSVNGSLVAEDSELEELEAELVSGGAELRLIESPERLKVSTVSGDVSLSIPADSDFSLKFSSVSGRLGGDYGLSGPGGSYRSGDGEDSFRINTVSGNLEINKR